MKGFFHSLQFTSVRIMVSEQDARTAEFFFSHLQDFWAIFNPIFSQFMANSEIPAHDNWNPTQTISSPPFHWSLNSWLVQEIRIPGADRSMLIALSKVGFIDGTINKPEGNLLPAWKCNNDIITSWIMNLVSKEIAASIIYTGSAKDIWEELKERFQQSNGICQFVNWSLLHKA